MEDGESSGTKEKQKEEMGMWLSLLPPGCHRCPICNKIFKSLQAVGGHENPHRTLQIKIQLNDVDANFYEEEKEVRDNKPIDDDQSCNCTGDESFMVVTKDHGVVANYEDLSEIDLNLHLGFGMRKKEIKFFDFMLVNRMKVDGAGVVCELPDLSLRIDGSEDGVGDGSGGNFPKDPVSDGKRRRKGRKKKSTSKKRVGLTL